MGWWAKPIYTLLQLLQPADIADGIANSPLCTVHISGLFCTGTANSTLYCAYIFAHTPVPRVASNLHYAHHAHCAIDSEASKLTLHCAVYVLYSVHSAQFAVHTMHWAAQSAVTLGSQGVGIGGFTRLLPCNYTQLLSIYTA